MKKKLLLTSLLLAMSTTVSASALSLVVNGSPLTGAEPTLIKGKTYVPVASIAQATGATAQWEGSTKTVIITKGETELKIKIGNKKAVKNNVDVALDAPAQVIKGKTFVPLSFVASNLDIPVQFDNTTKTVYIGDNITNNEQAPEQKDTSTTQPNNTQEGKEKHIVTDSDKEGKWIKGNKNSKIYHLPGGAHYYQVSEHNIVWFETAADAEAAGYRQAKN